MWITSIVMSYVSESIGKVSDKIAKCFDELIRILIKRSSKPLPIKNNKCKNNTGPHDIFNRYKFSPSADSIGWTGESFVHFKLSSKLNNIHEKNNKCAQPIKRRQNNMVPFSHRNTRGKCFKTPKMIEFTHLQLIESLTKSVNSSEIRQIESNDSKIKYSEAFKILEKIGEDIINETDPDISAEQTVKMDTSMLRLSLYELEKTISDLSVNNTEIYHDLIDMVKLINSVDRNNQEWLLTFIATTSYQRWEDIDDPSKIYFIDTLGNDFIDTYNRNNLIIILLQSGNSQYIISASYLYPLLKMLFVVFGNSKLIPHIIREWSIAPPENDKYYGAKLVRQSNYDYGHCQNKTKQINNLAPPTDPRIYDYISLFGELYPTIIGLMGGTEMYPPSMSIKPDDIDPNYTSLNTLAEYLWRFNDYSYCQYEENMDKKNYNKDTKMSKKIDSKISYLRTI
jgi:hypothetical protein